MNAVPWVWQAPSWPTLTYDLQRLAEPLRRAREEQGRLFGKAEAIGVDELARVQRDVWSAEAVATAAIEGEALDLASVRSSVARRLGITSDFIAAVPRNIGKRSSEATLTGLSAATQPYEIASPR
jgi:Fic family protein